MLTVTKGRGNNGPPSTIVNRHWSVRLSCRQCKWTLLV